LASPRKDGPEKKQGSLPPLPRSGRHAVAPRNGAPQGDKHDAPEVRIGYGAAGTETLEAITDELVRQCETIDEVPESDVPSSASRETQPERVHHEIVVEEDEKTLPRAGARTRVSTVGYGDRLSNAPGAVAPPGAAAPPNAAGPSRGGKSKAPGAPRSGPFAASKPPIPPRPAKQSTPPEPVPREPFQLSSPDLRKQAQISISEVTRSDDVPVLSLGDDGEPATGVRSRLKTLDFAERPRNRDTAPEVITIEERPIGRETLAAIAEELARENAAFLRDLPEDEDAAMDIMEMATFVVRGREVSRLSSDAARREFVAERLMHRLPVKSMDEVDRIDVTPWTVRGTVVLRVWCKVRPV
jgi:hypothetical protein